MEEQNRELIPELNKFFEHYRIRALVIDYHGVRNQLCAEAMGIRFVVEPFNGKADWELLFLKLERWKNGNKRDIRRAREGEREALGLNIEYLTALMEKRDDG